MPGRPEIIRLLALATFISVVALATWLAQLSRALVIVTIAAALVVSWTIEWFAWRETRLRMSLLASEEELDEGLLEDQREAPAVTEPARATRSWHPLRRVPAAREEEAPLKPPPAPAAPVIEGRARVVPADTAPAEPVKEPPVVKPAPPPAAEPTPPRAAEPAVERPPLQPVPSTPAPATEPASQESARVFDLAARTRGPRTWNLWELERLAREEFKGEALEESQYLFIHLRQFARADGQLPLEFDELVRDSFGGILERIQHA